jgi:23S rRNA (cytidine1920-2'-O)/16S rRNA (cytidine1409-2'-O)-methyltransferase
MGYAGNYSGHALDGVQPRLQPEEVAARIVEPALRPRRALFLGGPPLPRLVAALTPDAALRRAASWAQAGLETRPRAEPTTGNLRRPPRQAASLHGPAHDIRQDSARITLAAAGIATAVLLTVWASRAYARGRQTVSWCLIERWTPLGRTRSGCFTCLNGRRAKVRFARFSAIGESALSCSSWPSGPPWRTAAKSSRGRGRPHGVRCRRGRRAVAKGGTAGSGKVRLDQLLVERGLADSRARAQSLILAGRVFRGGERLDKAGLQLAPSTTVEVRQADDHVSRGAHKLIAGLDAFAIDPAGLVCLDVGASTGGFTDVLLRRGAKRVYAVDVGYGQLDARLRADGRVVVLERTNARHLTGELVPDAVGLVVCDASFISLRTVLPAPLGLAGPGAQLVALIKPQFEVGKGRVGKGGVVRDPALHDEVCADVAAWLGGLPGWSVLGIVPSPLLGPAGNREFLIGARRSAVP